jgi:hypothetical protein
MNTRQTATKKPLLKQEINSKGQQWKRGQSGNPKGRPRGTGKVAEMRDSIAEQIPAIINKLVDAAQNGDIQAARLLLDRVIPPLKATESPVELAMPTGTPADQSRAVLTAVGDGVITVQQGVQIIASLEALARLAKIDKTEKAQDEIDAKYSFDL